VTYAFLLRWALPRETAKRRLLEKIFLVYCHERKACADKQSQPPRSLLLLLCHIHLTANIIVANIQYPLVPLQSFARFLEYLSPTMMLLSRLIPVWIGALVALAIAAPPAVHAMNKSELIEAVAATGSGYSTNLVERVVDGFTGATTDALRRGIGGGTGSGLGSLAIANFGNFSLRAVDNGDDNDCGSEGGDESADGDLDVDFAVDLGALDPLGYHLYVEYSVAQFAQYVAQGINNPLYEEDAKGGQNALYKPTQFTSDNNFWSGVALEFVTKQDPRAILDPNPEVQRAYCEYQNAFFYEVGEQFVRERKLEGEQASFLRKAMHRFPRSLERHRKYMVRRIAPEDGLYNLIEAIGTRSGLHGNGRYSLNPEEILYILETMWRVIMQEISKGETVCIEGFGKWKMEDKPVSLTSSDDGGTAMVAKNVVKFIAGADLSKKVN